MAEEEKGVQGTEAEAEAETGFGTGLRTKLERRTGNGGASQAEVEALRAELAASLDRERELKADLDAAQLGVARPHDAVLGGDLAARSAELDVRAARLASG
ncbi:MAG: hypothetical protein ACRDM9_03495, partial [Gaiellaceae bacterium]